MARNQKPLKSELGRSTTDTVIVRGFDLPRELMGHIDFGDMAFLQITGRRPSSSESIVFNAMLVSLVEHGMTPSAIATRMVLAGAPEALQAAVGAGLNSLGSRFAGTMEGAARVLQAALPDAQTGDIKAIAKDVVEDHTKRRDFLPGIGHPLHTPVDPRAERLRAIAQEQDLAGPYVALMWEISIQASETSGRILPVNVTGAIGALLCELGLDWRLARGMAVMSRAVGLVGHAWEEMNTPMADEVYQRIDDEVSR
ncbi:citryl-CoA lyase [Rhizobium sp. EC-SD404]|uniref:citryl-CoA lyase n=1 Tax=Rhizobium sp. EC-SD404 TaxID=2038389 RepID=UPI00125A64AE|nr:citryl-CoA lyase [Rhizobium sp. EC-SD404]VVT31231.1 Citryl-CoA lyase [Rhizobium sp. EC-SD404]